MRGASVATWKTQEYGRTVWVVPRYVVHLSTPFFKRSMRHRGRILRFGLGDRGPVLRDHYGLY